MLRNVFALLTLAAALAACTQEDSNASAASNSAATNSAQAQDAGSMPGDAGGTEDRCDLFVADPTLDAQGYGCVSNMFLDFCTHLVGDWTLEEATEMCNSLDSEGNGCLREDLCDRDGPEGAPVDGVCVDWNAAGSDGTEQPGKHRYLYGVWPLPEVCNYQGDQLFTRPTEGWPDEVPAYATGPLPDTGAPSGEETSGEETSGEETSGEESQ